MAWQRLVIVGLYSFALTAVAHAAPAIEEWPGAVAEESEGTAAQHLDADAASTPSHGSSVASKKAARLLHARERKIGQVGYASWYGGELHGKSTASGGRFDKTE